MKRSAVHEVNIREEGKPPSTRRKVVQPTREESEQLAGLVGNGLAEIERVRSAKFGLDFGRLTIFSSCSVRLTCNQDEATVAQAIDVASGICDRVLFRDDTKLMQEFLAYYEQEK